MKINKKLQKTLIITLIAGFVLVAIFSIFLIRLVLRGSVVQEIIVEHEQEVIVQIEDIGEVALLKLSVCDIFDQTNHTDFFGHKLIGSEKTKFIRTSFNAKLGINSRDVRLREMERIGNTRSFQFTIPEFVFIGYDNFHSEVAFEKKGALSWTNSEIDSTEMINKILGEDNQKEYLQENIDLLKESCESFYSSFVRSLVPDAYLSFIYQ